ncbi:nitroreductase [Bacillus aerolatus]|uniref:Nitroreductase n=1 Tax=Bacillus aerolatus TaxID=2653354 RepID=A0A6I1FRZ8_9BACI|nr:nitroreductase family protein [Bacillus aerolatus]KAB7707420.1 nitroreductase [Bacillus aerolatus]
MNVHETIEKRREITAFLAQKVDEDALNRIIRAGYLAPAGNNLPSRELIVVTDREKLVHLSTATPFMKWLADAGAGIAITGRPDVSKYWLQDASIASAFIWLAAEQEQLGAAFGAIYHSEDAEESEKRESHVRKALSIPDDRRIVTVMGIGQISAEPKPKKHIPFEEIVYREYFR